MKKILLFLFLVAIGGRGFSQQITRHNVYFELGGASFFYSVNYEYLLLDNTETNVAFRLGGDVFTLEKPALYFRYSGGIFMVEKTA